MDETYSERSGTRWSTQNKVTTAFAVVLLIQSIISVQSYRATSRFADAVHRRQHTHNVLVALQRVELELKDAETRVRGYVITNDQRFFAPYQASIERVAREFKRLRELTAGRPQKQQERLDALDPLVKRAFNEFNATIELRRQEGFHAAAQMVAADESGVASDKVSELIGEIRSEERQSLNAVYEAATAGGRTAERTVALGTVMTFLLVGIAVVFINQDIAERQEANKTTRQRNEELHTLSRRLVEIQEAERRRIARDLHDEVGQLLTGLQYLLDSAALEPEAGAASLAEASKIVSELIGHVRGLSLDLRPSMLDDLGLLPALRWHCDRYSAQTGVRVHVKHSGLEPSRFPLEVETAIYRIVQEALTNVARHTQVHEVTLCLWTTAEIISAQVEDHGNGFDPDAVRAVSSGLSGIRERAQLLGGHLTITSTPGAGTCVTAEIPFKSVAPGGRDIGSAQCI